MYKKKLLLCLAGIMYMDDSTYSIKGKTYRRVLLWQSYRDSDGKAQHRNIANIPSCSEEEIQVIKFVLKHKDNPDFICQQTRAKTQNWKIVGPSLLLTSFPARLASASHLNDSIQKLKLDPILQVKTAEGERQIELSQNDEELGNASKLDGCYVIKTDLTEKKDKKEKIHSLYQSLASVEWAFRTEKSQLEIRPIYLRKEHRTRGHLMVCMLSYKIEKYLRQCWKGLDITVEEGMEKLSSIVGMKTLLGPTKEILWIPEPDELNRQLLDRANVILPTHLPAKETLVSTNEKLTKHRR